MKKLLFILIFVFACGKPQTNTLPKDIFYTIASYNVQFFNDKKNSNEDIMRVISSIIVKFDIVAFQEIQGKKNSTLHKLHARVKGSHNYIASPRLGRSKYYKEQYAYFYDKKIFKPIDFYVYNDKLDEFSREPLVAKFQVISKNKEIVLINIHTPPKSALKEITKLPKVIEDARIKYKNNDGIIVLGDFNADCSYYQENNYHEVFPGRDYIWSIHNDFKTSVVSGCTYDRIVLTNSLRANFVVSGVYDVKLKHGLTLKQTLKVSDHYPVWVQLKM